MVDANKIEAFKNRNGCEGRLSEKPRQTYDTLRFHSCYCNHLSPSFDSFLYIHEQYGKGFLPFQGALLDQPNKVMDVIALVSKLKAEREAKMQKDVK